ncbi:hypothetical protein Acr_03g0012040 [Actinidia rufa]|uniref:COP1-interacting protein-like protein n=1 Tax=Actinidia rufa TaxID=165716 RepID=A0A7J0EDH0_9ERIC|nr:hypothetical protein Acr_03g0012040 [Actinidia rufa]
MDGDIDANAPLDYAEFQLFPSQDRYEACVCSGNKVERIASGLLGQLVLHLPDRRDHSGDGKAVSCNLNGMGQKLEDEVKIVSSDESKNELLRAMNLRLATLRGELVAAFNRAAGATCSSNNIFDMEKLCQHFEAIDLRNTLRKFVVLGQVGQTADLPGVEKSPSTVDSRNNRANEPEGNAQLLKPSHSDTPVTYGVSPLPKLPRLSDRAQQKVRNLVTQVAMISHPWKEVGLSLGLHHLEDRTLSCREATEDSNEDEGTEQPPPRSDGNVRRMSVQDAISLFEGKRKDQISDIHQGKSTLDAFAGTNKSVLRRWSSGMGDSSTQRLPEIVSESSDPMTSDYLEGVEIPRSSLEAKPEPEFISGDNSPVETVEENANLDTVEERMSNPVSSQADTLGTQREENTERLTASVEWNRQKEEELNQMLMKMMERKRDEKLRGETAGKRAEKAAQFRAMQQVLDERKSEMASANLKGRKTSLTKPQKSLKSATQSTIPKKEPSKPVVTKKALSKSSSSPATRKSWPSTPSPRATTRISPAKTLHGTSSSAATPTCQKTQLAPSGSRSSPKLERSVQKPKNVKPSQNDTRKSMKDVTPKPQHPLTKNGKTGKTKVQTTPVKDRPVAEAKPSFYNKVTKKSSVVPLESKPFLRKGSGIGPGVGPVVKTKASSQPEETLKSSDLIQAQENELVIDTSDPVSQQQEGDFEAPETHAGLESETQLTTQQKYDGILSSEQVIANCNDSFVMATESELKTEVEEESVISPTAWIEIEEHQNLSIPSDYSTCEIASAANVASIPTSSPHVRHSLSKMLLEESAERDIIEWGNAENPPVMVYQKDAPKGEDDAEESKAASKKNADNLRRKTALHAKNYGQQKASLGEGYEENSAFPEILSAHSNTSKFSAQSSSHKLQDHISVAATTTKGSNILCYVCVSATRSFFSLSAFRGSKPNEMKLR